MGKRPDLSVEMVDAAREIVRKTRDAGELRRALSVFLSGVMGLTLPRVGDLIGRSRATVARFHAEFREWLPGRQDKEISWGGRRRAYLTFEEEKEFLLGFFEVASRGGIVVVSEVRTALEKRLEHKVAETTVYRMLERHGWRKIVPRRRHPKADRSTQEGFKKSSK
ncbi:MAG: helix-turn-helix domain-containing protein [Desulfomonilaceae bacterium]